MIKNIRRRFIRIALTVLALAMVLVTGIINAANWINVRSELHETLSALAAGGGHKERGGRKGNNRHMRNTLDEAQFFSVLVLDDGTCEVGEISRDQSVDAAEQQRLAEQALKSGRASGFLEDYLFAVTEQRGQQRLVFLNCETKLTRVRRLAIISAAACAACILLAWLLVAKFSSRAIQPMVENALMQKRFITDAGHELKTPLTVISANMDVLSLETGPNEWIQSTQRQVSNMRGLVNELIYLSRLDEEDNRLQMSGVDLTQIVRETAEPFVAMAEFAGKAMALELQEGVRMTGDPAALQRLVSILCDNAVKYAPEGDAIAVTLRREKRDVALTTENSAAEPLSPEQLQHLFDRFYRVDQSRNKDRGGYGIGLSVARAIVDKHGGTIAAEQTGNRLRFVCRMPPNTSGKQHA